MKSVETWIQKSLHSDHAVTDDHFKDSRAYTGTPSFGPNPHSTFVPRSPSYFGTHGPSMPSPSREDSRPDGPNLQIGSV